MAMPVEKIEVGFDTSFSAVGDFFILDDATKGVLDNTTYLLAGITFIDITDRARNFTISRGRSSLFSAFPTGQLNVEFNNHDRAFDPLYTQSPFVGNIIPKREIRVTTSNQVQYSGWVEDWNFSYSPNGDSIAQAIAYDAIGILSGQTLAAGTPTAQKTGARVNAVLDEIQWTTALRDIDTGTADLSAFPIADGTNVMSYLQTVAASELGLMFVDKFGSVRFIESNPTPDLSSVLQFGGTGIPFQNLEVSYGADNLYNQIVVSREGGGTATASDTQSITDYGLRVLSAPTVLLDDDTDLANYALALAQEFSQPEYRFQSLEVAVHKLNDTQQAELLQLEIGDFVLVAFTPNGIGSPISRFVQIISINHTVRPETHFIEYGLQSADISIWTLSDSVAGRLSAGNVLG